MDEVMRARTVKSIHTTVMTFYKKGFKDCAYSLQQAMVDSPVDKFITLEELSAMLENLDETLDITLESYSDEVKQGIEKAIKSSVESGEIEG